MVTKLSSPKINTKFPNLQVRNAQISKEERDTRTFSGPGFPNGKNDVRPRLQTSFYWLSISYIQLVYSLFLSQRDGMVHFRQCCFKSRLVRLPRSGNFSDLKIEFSQHNARLGKAYQLRKTQGNISENGRLVQSLKVFIPDQRPLFSLLVNAKCFLWRKFEVRILFISRHTFQYTSTYVHFQANSPQPVRSGCQWHPDWFPRHCKETKGNLLEPKV